MGLLFIALGLLGVIAVAKYATGKSSSTTGDTPSPGGDMAGQPFDVAPPEAVGLVSTATVASLAALNIGDEIMVFLFHKADPAIAASATSHYLQSNLIITGLLPATDGSIFSAKVTAAFESVVSYAETNAQGWPKGWAAPSRGTSFTLPVTFIYYVYKPGEAIQVATSR